MKYVIKYSMKPNMSFYRQMTAIGPQFGAPEDESPTFASKLDAQKVIDTFPLVAAVCCEVVKSVRRAKK